MIQFLSIAILLLTVSISGCTLYQINSKDESMDYYAPKTSLNDVVYVESTDKPYIVIATISVTTERNQSLEEILPKLQQEAGLLGADAVTDVQNGATTVWKKYAPKKLLGNAYIRTTYTAKAIVWK